MSDVKCARCHEPWDTYHLQHDAPHDALAEVVPGVLAAKAMQDGWYAKHDKPRLDTIIPHTMHTWREAFSQAGWEFGRVVTDVRRCPCCKENGADDSPHHFTDESPACTKCGGEPGYDVGAKCPGTENNLRDELAALLGDDEDGLAATLEDLED